MSITENTRFNGSIDQINFVFVEREGTQQFLMRFSIQLRLARLSLSNTVTIMEPFGVEHACSTVHNWIPKADLQPKDGHSPDHVAVGKTVTQLNDEQ